MVTLIQFLEESLHVTELRESIDLLFQGMKL